MREPNAMASRESDGAASTSPTIAAWAAPKSLPSGGRSGRQIEACRRRCGRSGSWVNLNPSCRTPAESIGRFVACRAEGLGRRPAHRCLSCIALWWIFLTIFSWQQRSNGWLRCTELRLQAMPRKCSVRFGGGGGGGGVTWARCCYGKARSGRGLRRCLIGRTLASWDIYDRIF